jgi:hypothetical protein
MKKTYNKKALGSLTKPQFKVWYKRHYPKATAEEAEKEYASMHEKTINLKG